MNEQIDRVEHPETKYPKNDITRNGKISKEMLAKGNIDNKFPIVIDEKTIVYITNPTTERIKQIQAKYSRHKVEPKIDTDEPDNDV